MDVQDYSGLKQVFVLEAPSFVIPLMGMATI